MTETDVISPDLASVQGYHSDPLPRSSSSLGESVVGLKQSIPIRVRRRPPYNPSEFIEPPWLAPAIKRLVELMALPADWDSYGARPVRRENVEGALQALVAVMSGDSELPWIVPLPSGGIQLEWHQAGSDIEISLDASDSSIVIDGEEIPHGIGRWPSALDEISRRLAP